MYKEATIAASYNNDGEGFSGKGDDWIETRTDGKAHFLKYSYLDHWHELNPYYSTNRFFLKFYFTPWWEKIRGRQTPIMGSAKEPDIF